MNILQSLNLFPYTQLWRLGHQPYHSNKCGIIFSILIVLVLGYVLIERSITVLQRETLSSTSQVIVDPEPVETVISTAQDSQLYQPFMIAYDLHSDNYRINLSNIDLQIQASISSSTGEVGTRSLNQTMIHLVPCTVQHFSKFPNVSETFFKLRAHKWQCLPLNEQYLIKSTYILNGDFQYLSLKFNCSGPCMATFQNINIWLYTLNSAVNPTNSEQAESFFLSRVTIPVIKQTARFYVYQLAQNILDSDKSLFPWKDVQTSRSLLADRFELLSERTNLTFQSSTQVIFERSIKTYYYENNFLKLVEAFAYVGGIFEALIGAFFFMSIFGRIFFEFKFTKLYLKNKAVQNFGLTGYLKQLIYQTLYQIKCKLSWEQAQQRYNIRRSMNNMLDIVYLQKRIDFLESSISTVLKEHQLQGIHLLRGKSRKQVDENYFRHSFRDRLIYFFAKRKKLLNHDSQSSDKNTVEENIVQSSKKIELKPVSKEFIGKQIDSASNLKKMSEDMLFDKSKIGGPNSSIENTQNPEPSQKYAQKILAETVKTIRQIDQQQELSEQDFKKWFQNDFRQLTVDMKNDRRSEEIYLSIQEWLLTLIKRTAQEIEEQMGANMKEIILEPIYE